MIALSCASAMNFGTKKYLIAESSRSNSFVVSGTVINSLQKGVISEMKSLSLESTNEMRSTLWPRSTSRLKISKT